MKQHQQQQFNSLRRKRINIYTDLSPQIEVLTEAETQSVNGGMSPYIPPAVLDYIISQSKKCQYDPDSAKLPCSD